MATWQIVFDVLTILALLGGPVIAVRIIRRLDDRKERRDRRLGVFRDLMSSRAYMVSWQHVQALNRIDVEFTLDEDKEIIASWKAYLNFLTVKGLSNEEWALRRAEHEVELLQTMGKVLGYSFDKTDLMTLAYHPQLHTDIDTFQEEMRTAFRGLMAGTRAIPIFVYPTPPVPPQRAMEVRVQHNRQGSRSEKGRATRKKTQPFPASAMRTNSSVVRILSPMNTMRLPFCVAAMAIRTRKPGSGISQLITGLCTVEGSGPF
ncbi:MAG: DUF6680 family protein [Spirochaetia bacterium]|jgi:hypothetical protein